MKPGRAAFVFFSHRGSVRLYHPDRLKSSGGMLSQAQWPREIGDLSQSRGGFLFSEGRGDQGLFLHPAHWITKLERVLIWNFVFVGIFDWNDPLIDLTKATYWSLVTFSSNPMGFVSGDWIPTLTGGSTSHLGPIFFTADIWCVHILYILKNHGISKIMVCRSLDPAKKQIQSHFFWMVPWFLGIYTYMYIYIYIYIHFLLKSWKDFCCFNHQRFQAAAQRSHEQQMAALNAAKRVLSDARLEEILWWKKIKHTSILKQWNRKGGGQRLFGFCRWLRPIYVFVYLIVLKHILV